MAEKAHGSRDETGMNFNDGEQEKCIPEWKHRGNVSKLAMCNKKIAAI